MRTRVGSMLQRKEVKATCGSSVTLLHQSSDMTCEVKTADGRILLAGAGMGATFDICVI